LVSYARAGGIDGQAHGWPVLTTSRIVGAVHPLLPHEAARLALRFCPDLLGFLPLALRGKGPCEQMVTYRILIVQLDGLPRVELGPFRVAQLCPHDREETRREGPIRALLPDRLEEPLRRPML